MSFQKKRQNMSGGLNRLASQTAPPSFKQLQAMLQDSARLSGHTSQLPFGDSAEKHVLILFRERPNSEAQWSLYRYEGTSSVLVWDKRTNDPGFIHQLIFAQFPGLDLKQVALRTQAATIDQSHERTESKKGAHRLEFDQGKNVASFEGDLKDISLSNAMQSVAASNGTGRLEIDGATEWALIYFENGNPVHSVSRGFAGEPSILEMLGLQNGHFRFYPGYEHETKSIKRKLASLLMESSLVEDQWQLLKKFGASEHSIVKRKHKSLTEKEFESIFAGKTLAELEWSKRVYLQIDNRTTLKSIIRRFNMPKPYWIPIFLSLFNFGLIDFTNAADSAVNTTEIDFKAAEGARSILLRPDTGIHSHTAFLYFLKNELWRWERFNRPFSIIILKLSNPATDAESSERLTLSAVRSLTDQIKRFITRKTDVLAHYETFDFAILLPETDSHCATAYAHRLVEFINTPGTLNVELGSIKANAGVACVPDDCSSLETMLAMARPRSVADRLSETTERIKAVVDNASDIICITDLDLRLLEVNTACEEVFGYKSEELIGKRLTTLFPGDDGAIATEKIQSLVKSIDGSDRIILENKIIKADGANLHFQWTVRWSREKGMFFYVGRDITAQKELERLKTELIRMVSHDLRSPAMAVDGFLEALEFELTTAPEQQHWLPMHKAAQTAAGRIVKLINDLLAFEQISETVVTLNYDRVAVNEIFAQSIASIPNANQNVQSIENAIALECDKDRVVQIVVNLLANAIKFSPPGKPVTLKAEENDVYVVISIVDSGPGIEPEFLELIFKPFKQMPEKRNGRTKSGFGLGLSIAKSLTELHKGKIAVDSKVGAGSTFSVWLPKQKSGQV
jgi:PAS domain S-box-containing protein